MYIYNYVYIIIYIVHSISLYFIYFYRLPFEHPPCVPLPASYFYRHLHLVAEKVQDLGMRILLVALLGEVQGRLTKGAPDRVER